MLKAEICCQSLGLIGGICEAYYKTWMGSIRKERTGEYRIPHGDWFELVSSPHYLAEMVFLSLSPSFIVSPYKMFTLRLYMQAYWLQVGELTSLFGYFLYLWYLFPLQLRRVANLGFAATETQRWYLHKFEDYPRKRRACLPYIY
ncbi:Polyprenol reductase 1 [Vitis vinifera]|uniref:Polyprenol reductase 1 n=1 Tax=Vitis vinifera TaxID=29760 RepID=A0A438K5Y3_VITVI|nr:Polyprenol reductase 1 [Vitis vinifera]